MINIRLKINGSSPVPGDVVGAVERAAIEGIRDDLARKLEAALTPEEQGQLTVELTGDDIASLEVNLSGPTEIILKARRALEKK